MRQRRSAFALSGLAAEGNLRWIDRACVCLRGRRRDDERKWKSELTVKVNMYVCDVCVKQSVKDRVC